MPTTTVLFVLLSVMVVLGLQNITVDDSDSSIQYSGNWVLSDPSLLDYGGAHHFAEQPGPTATFSFVGVAIYIMAPLWPYAVGAQLTLDGTQSKSVSFQDFSRTATDGGPETVASAVVFGFTQLTNGQHTLIVSFADGMQYLALDALVYTVDDNATSTTTSTTTVTSTPSSFPTTSSSSASTSTTASASSSSSSTKVLPIALGTALGVVGLLALVAIVILIVYCLRKKRREEKYDAPTSYTGPSASSMGGGGPASLDHSSGYLVEAYQNPGLMIYPDSHFQQPARPATTPSQLYSRSPAVSTTTAGSVPLAPVRFSPDPVPPVPIIPPVSIPPSRTTTAYDSASSQHPIVRPPLAVRNATPNDHSRGSSPAPSQRSVGNTKAFDYSAQEASPNPPRSMLKADFLAKMGPKNEYDIDNPPMYSSQ